MGVMPPSLNFSYSIPQPSRKVKPFLKKFLRQVAQIWEKDQAKVCAICLLTFCVGCGIMEIRPGASDNGPPKFVQIAQKERGRGVSPHLCGLPFNNVICPRVIMCFAYTLKTKLFNISFKYFFVALQID